MDIIKLGGSVITSPDSEDKFNQPVVQRLAEEFATSQKTALLIHGTGHIGKPPAIEHGYVETGFLEQERAQLAMQIKTKIRHLNQKICDTFREQNIPILPLQIENLFKQNMEEFKNEQIKQHLNEVLTNNVTPIIYGDFMPQPNGGFQVFSSDKLTRLFVQELKPDRAIFLTDVPGVYEDQERTKIIPEIHKHNLDELYLFDSDKQDVSGGMTDKINDAMQIAAHCKECIIGSGLIPGDFTAILQDTKNVGTKIITRK